MEELDRITRDSDVLIHNISVTKRIGFAQPYSLSISWKTCSAVVDGL